MFPTTFDILVLKSGREAWFFSKSIILYIESDKKEYKRYKNFRTILLSGELMAKLTGRYIEIDIWIFFL